jgi:hypothetical protein
MKPTPVRIAPELFQACEAARPTWFSATSFINEMIRKGLDSIDRDVTLGEPSEQRDTQTERGSTLIDSRYIETKKNKEKNFSRKVRFKFNKALIPFDLDVHASKIEDFWKVKTGAKSEAAWNLLMTGLQSIQTKYDDQTVGEQLDLAIVGGPKGPWSSITLKNYEQFKKPTSFNQEPSVAHPAHRVFTSDGGFQE